MPKPLNVSFCIDGPPVPWPRTRHHGKKHYNPPAYNEYKGVVAVIAQSAWRRPPMDGPVALEAVFLVKEKATRTPDTTNLLKALEDACEGIIVPCERFIDPCDG